MKKNILLLVLLLAQSVVGFAKTNDVFMATEEGIKTFEKYIDTLFFMDEYSHADDVYTLYSSEYIRVGDYFYNVKIYDSIYDKEEADGLDLTDSLFSKIVVDCIVPMRNNRNEIVYNADGSPVSSYMKRFQFINDNTSVAFSQRGLGLVVNKVLPPSRKAYRTIPLSSDRIALAFRGRQDACSLRQLLIIVLDKMTATLVFNKEVEVTDIIEQKNLETFVIQDNWYEDCVELVPHLRNMVFGFGKITIEE